MRCDCGMQIAVGIAAFFAVSCGVLSFVYAVYYAVRSLGAEVVSTVRNGAAEAEHWSPERRQLDAPLGPFRDAPLNDVRPRGAPIYLRGAAGLGVLIGFLTSCLIAPIALAWTSSHHRLPLLFAWCGALMAISGLVAGVLLVSSATRAVKGKRAHFPAFLYVHYFASTFVWVWVAAHFHSTMSAYISFAYGALGFLLTLVFAEAHRFGGASEDATRASERDTNYPRTAKTSPS